MTRYIDARGREVFDQYGRWQRVEFVAFWDLPMGQEEGDEIAIEAE